MVLLDVASAHVDSVAVSIDIVVSESSKSCSAEALKDALLSASTRNVELRDDADVHLALEIEADGDRLRATARFDGTSGGDERTLVAMSCDELRDAFVLVASTWLDAEPASSVEEASPPVARAPAPPEEPDEDVGAPTRKTRRRPFTFGTQVFAFTGVGSVAVGGGVSLAFSTETFELRGGARFASSGDSVEDVGRASYRLWTLALDGCLGQPAAVPLSLSACARLGPGVFTPSVAGNARTLGWLTVGLGGRAGWSVGPVILEAEAFLDGAMLGYRLTPTASKPVAFRALLPSAALGLAFPLP